MQILYKNSKLGNYCHFNRPEAEVRWAGPEQILTGHKQVLTGFVQVGEDEQGQPIFDESQPVYEDGDPIYEDGDDLFSVEWDEAWGAPPTEDEVAAFIPPPPPDPSPLTDVNSPIPSILKGYEESEAARAERIKLLKSTASYALGAKIAGELAAANPPTNAEELAELKAEAKSQASALGGAFFDKYFSWIGAYREGGGPGFLAAVQADSTTEFLNWPTPEDGITLPDGAVVLPGGGIVEDLFSYFLT